MIAAEIDQLIEQTVAALPDRISGNEANQVVAERLRGLAVSDRESLICYLRHLMSFRLSGGQRTSSDAVPEAGIWMALHVAEALGLQELRPDIQKLSCDIERGLIFKAVHQSMVDRYLERMVPP